MEEETRVSEEWRPVVGYEGFYEVSSHGRVRSLDRRVQLREGVTRLAAGRLMVPWLQKAGGYPAVTLCKSGKELKRTVHSLVAEAFLGPRPTGLMICHGDSNPRNNSVSNLRYDTQAANMDDARRHGKPGGRKRQTHCHRGHLVAGDNEYVRPSGKRACRECRRIDGAVRRQKKKLS